MELDELKTAWQALDARVARQHALELHVFKESRLKHVRWHLLPLHVESALEILAGLVIVVLAGRFWTAHRAELAPLVAGLVVHLYGVLLIGTAVYQLILLARLDFAAPVLTIQKGLATLHEQRVRAATTLGLAWWILWIALLVCCARAFVGVDLFQRFPAWLLGNLAVGILGIFLSLRVLRWLRRRLPRAGDGTALGWLLTRAHRQLDEVERFERDG